MDFPKGIIDFSCDLMRGKLVNLLYYKKKKKSDNISTCRIRPAISDFFSFFLLLLSFFFFPFSSFSFLSTELPSPFTSDQPSFAHKTQPLQSPAAGELTPRSLTGDVAFGARKRRLKRPPPSPFWPFLTPSDHLFPARRPVLEWALDFLQDYTFFDG